MNTSTQETGTLPHLGPARPAAKTDRLAWWRRARFGLFIHWGPYSLLAGEWQGKRIDDGIGYGVGEWIMYNAQIPVSEYEQVARAFNPVEFDAEAWASLAARTGQKYLIITAKHHDGFALFDSRASDYNIVEATGFGRDIIKELAAACRRHGIRFGIYYSHAQDWRHPGGAAFNGRDDPTAPWSGGEPGAGRWDPVQEGDFDEYLQKVAQQQVLELLTRYGPIDIFWWDTPIGMTPERAASFQSLLQLQPDIITNNRLLDPDHPNAFSGDTETPEQYIPATGLKGREFEVCMTVNDTWGYKEHDHNWKSTRTLIRQLVDTVSKGGNFLLNIGPDALGRIPPACLERLEAVGRWMDVNAESIDGAEASPFAKLPWGRCTRRTEDRKTCLYLHVFRWPETGELLVPGLRSSVAQASLLASGTPLETVRRDNDTLVSLPAQAPDADVSVIRLELDGAPEIIPLRPGPNAEGRLRLPAWLADIHNRSYGGQAFFDVDAETPAIRAWTDCQTRLTWAITIDTPGIYELSAEWLSPTPGASLCVSVGNDSTVAALPTEPTPGLTSLAQLTLTQTGPCLLTLEPLEERWRATDLVALELRRL
ncbi:MAG: alpha-L-fucosidase [Verrucomicrobiota bacterium JB024]|nr:alpha-L-fucosidase [Verrucomicrobiota bacterium JB024]